MDLLRAQAQDCRGPGAAPIPVRDHLALVDHRHIVAGLQVRHLYRRRLYPAERHPDLLLACHQRAGHIVQIQRLKLFRGQQPQRPEINAPLRPVQALDTLVGLPGVGRPQMQHKTPVHLPGQGIQIPVVLGHCVQERPAKRPLMQMFKQAKGEIMARKRAEAGGKK